jgi:hypothetical protein
MKAVIITFFDIKGIIYTQFIPPGQNYVEILKQLHETVGRKGLNFGQVIGFTTMTMLQQTRHSLLSTF